MIGWSSKNIYSVVKYLVLRARSEIVGFAVIECHGKLEYWNVEQLDLNALFQYSIIPIFQDRERSRYGMGRQV